MPVIDSYDAYFRIITQFNQAPTWQKRMMLEGALLTSCREIEPAHIRLKLRKFWQKQAALLGLNVEGLKTWV